MMRWTLACLRRGFVWMICCLGVVVISACGTSDDKTPKGNNDLECTSNADCENGVCDLASNTCQGGTTNNQTNNETNNGTNNETTNNGPTCGDGVVEGNETCDGDCPTDCDDGDACTVGSLEGLAENCTASCTFSEVTACTSGDGCCPDGCTAERDTDCMATCGDGVLDPDEHCDFGIEGGEGTCPVGPADCNDNDACTIDAVTGDPGECTAQCVNEPIVACVDDDGCCPGACNTTNDNDCMPKVGQPCTTDAECPATVGPGFCMTEQDWRWPGGYCTGGCTSDADCADGAHCTGRTCVPDCTTSRDCRMGYSCYDYWGTGQDTCAPTPGTAEIAGGGCADDSDCLGALFGASCNDDAALPDGYCISGCEVDQDCAAGTHCATFSSGGQACVPDCADDMDCRQGYECFDWFGDVSNTCGPVANGTGEVGDACTVLQDCAGGQDGLCIQSPDWDGGYCAETGCMADADCPTGSHCAFIDPATGTGICLKDCVDADECRTNYSCEDLDDDTTLECGPSGNGPGAAGDPCVGVFECSGGTDAFCLQDSTGWPDGYCASSGCLTDADCDAEAHCGFINPDNGEGVCVDSCAADDECRPDYGCFDLDSDSNTECLPEGDGGVGEQCRSFVDCAGRENAACATDAAGWPDGYCLLNCTAGTGATCPTGSTCVTFDVDTDFCLDSCTATADCRAGYSCEVIDAASNMACIPI